MITEMEKISFLVFYKDYTEFLEKIRTEGVLHVESKAQGMPTEPSLIEKLKLQDRLQNAIRILKNKKVEQKEPPVSVSGDNILSRFEKLPVKTEDLNLKSQSLKKTLSQLEPWGNFSWNNIDNLINSGKIVSFWSCNKSSFKEEWIEKYNAFNIQTTSTTVFFVTITDKVVTKEIEAENLKLPRAEISYIQTELEKIKSELSEIENEYNELASYGLPLLQKYQDEIHNEFSFEKVTIQTEKHAEDRIMVLEGWIPFEKKDSLINMLESEGVYYEIRSAENEDNPPILLKNNWFSRLFEPIGALYALPNYREIDLTPYFAPFYWLFFGFCLGDAGYGIFLAIIALILIYKGSKKLVPYMKLVLLLGISTFLFGAISGTFFGISLYDTGFWFYADINENLKANGKSINDILFMGAIAFGAFQVIFGMFIKAANEIKQSGWKYSIGTFGWLILILGTVAFYLMPKKEAAELSIKIGQYILYGISGCMILLFNSPGKSIFSNIGSGLWGAYNMVTGLLGDILSYIRLFALGISSGILGFVFNLLATQLSGDIPVVSFIIMAAILLFGHAVNLFMGALGGFVHSMRLTFVEFYKNSTFAGGGSPYSPFSKK
ncbi:MAG: V-type ATP synthase subunit I [Prolixibacteraceae bacterium]|nr:V-type ATP synthase subunit I [Prolixibacteraceae bacterium]